MIGKMFTAASQSGHDVARQRNYIRVRLDPQLYEVTVDMSEAVRQAGDKTPPKDALNIAMIGKLKTVAHEAALNVLAAGLTAMGAREFPPSEVASLLNFALIQRDVLIEQHREEEKRLHKIIEEKSVAIAVLKDVLGRY